ncbi:O-antigen ligase family protein [Candidatus Saccharibacteria bacterium]|nr:O-antigen ligase family protein [Candidatus Saccharibacteria bacterium]
MKSQLKGMAAGQGFARLAGLFAAGAVALVIALMSFHAFLSTWAGAALGNELVWKSWKELVLGVAIIGLLTSAYWYRDVFLRVVRRPISLVIFAFLGLHLLLAAILQTPGGSTLAGLMTNLRFLAIFLLAQLLVELFPHGTVRLRTWLTRTVLVCGVLVALIGLLQVTVIPRDFLVQFGYDKFTTIAPFILVDEQEHALRAFATLRGPNTLGMFLLLPLGMLSVLAARRQRLALTVPAVAIVALGIFATGSRSAWLGAVAVMIALLLALAGRKRLLRLAKRYGALVVIILGVLVLVAESVPAIRLAIFHSSPGDPSLTEGSTDKHFEATAGGIVDAALHPFGRGPGEAGPASFYSPNGPRIAENYYVQVAQEVGIIGLGLLLTILYIVARRLWRLVQSRGASPLALGLFASFWGIAVINLFLHGWADDPTALVWWGLAGLLPLADNGTHERSTRRTQSGKKTDKSPARTA